MATPAVHPATCRDTRTLTTKSLEKFARAWGGRIPEEKGMVVTDMMKEAEEGRLKAMYVVGENPTAQ